jgi:hypothetical protein
MLKTGGFLFQDSPSDMERKKKKKKQQQARQEVEADKKQAEECSSEEPDGDFRLKRLKDRFVQLKK